LISGAGFEVRVFDRPSELLKDDLPKTDACFVVDVHLPEMSGVELCETLGASGCRLPVVLITADTGDGTRTLALSAHPVALLIKPFRRAELVNSIQIALSIGKNS
jgi:two-component system response regulator FixJ